MRKPCEVSLQSGDCEAPAARTTGQGMFEGDGSCSTRCVTCAKYCCRACSTPRPPMDVVCADCVEDARRFDRRETAVHWSERSEFSDGAQVWKARAQEEHATVIELRAELEKLRTQAPPIACGHSARQAIDHLAVLSRWGSPRATDIKEDRTLRTWIATVIYATRVRHVRGLIVYGGYVIMEHD